jgi:hypothetical protein
MPSDKELEAAAIAVRVVARACCLSITSHEAREAALAALEAAEVVRKEECVPLVAVEDPTLRSTKCPL